MDYLAYELYKYDRYKRGLKFRLMYIMPVLYKHYFWQETLSNMNSPLNTDNSDMFNLLVAQTYNKKFPDKKEELLFMIAGIRNLNIFSKILIQKNLIDINKLYKLQTDKDQIIIINQEKETHSFNLLELCVLGKNNAALNFYLEYLNSTSIDSISEDVI